MIEQQTKRSRSVPPRASAMVEALRGMGYTTATALADIIDNSIGALATQIDLEFVWTASDSVITVLDNGSGMTPIELERAMRLGDRSPLDQRNTNDLGRFGLGLKTASFSQCRALTVSTIRDGMQDTLRWDLDHLASSDDDGWHLLEGASDQSASRISILADYPSGTLVIWEKLDRIVTPGFSDQDFLNLIDEVEEHLAMIFHRYLEGSSPKLKLRINGKCVQPWDPFLKGHAATWSSPIERIRANEGMIELQGFVLPHKDHLDSRTEREAAGPEGWTAQQGFYVYRNERLLVPGSWIGLGPGWTKDEAHRLARIRLDLPNSADADWKIDIRKSTARPPVWLKGRLSRLAGDTRDKARNVFAHRGAPQRAKEGDVVEAVWRADRSKTGMRYRVEESHPAVAAVLQMAGAEADLVRMMIRLIEETVPVQRIWLDTAEAKETPRTRFEGEPSAEVRQFLNILYSNLISRKGLSPALARQQLLHTEPFQAYPQLIATLADDIA